MIVDFEIIGKAQAKQRPRFSEGTVYTPKETREFSTFVGFSFIASRQPKLYGAIRAVMEFTLPIPKTVLKEVKKNPDFKPFPTRKPDLDNLVKGILDALNKLAYDDDSQIVELLLVKRYGVEEKTRVILTEIDELIGV